MPPQGAKDAARRNPFIGLENGGAVTMEASPKFIGTANSDRHGADNGHHSEERQWAASFAARHEAPAEVSIAHCILRNLKNVDRQLPQGDEVESC
ncbi:hypothetical protein BM1_02247 [Bipolaris maydis]|nr:hypothetical protein BM1_02247 [Bipolaris maydis]